MDIPAPAEPMDPESLDRSDMIRLAEGHDAALDELMERHGGRLYRYLLRFVHNESEAEDLAQETFLRVYQNRARFDPEKKFSTWLYTIASNLAKNTFRWRTRHPEVALENLLPTEDDYHSVLPSSAPGPGEELIRAERAEGVRRAIAGLPDELRIPLLLAEYEECSQAEIAQVLGCTVKAVENRLYRARHRLRQALSKRPV